MDQLGFSTYHRTKKAYMYTVQPTVNVALNTYSWDCVIILNCATVPSTRNGSPLPPGTIIYMITYFYGAPQKKNMTKPRLSNIKEGKKVFQVTITAIV